MYDVIYMYILSFGLFKKFTSPRIFAKSFLVLTFSFLLLSPKLCFLSSLSYFITFALCHLYFIKVVLCNLT